MLARLLILSLLAWLALLTLPATGLLPLGLALEVEAFLGLVLLSTAFAALCVAPWCRRRISRC